MAAILFPSFLEEEDTYDQAADYWRRHFEALLEDLDYGYEPYLNTTMVDGTPLRDGNPIFNAFLPVLRRAVRIIQEDPAVLAEIDEPVYYSRWIDHTEDAEEQPFDELVISLVLTGEALERALRDMGTWVAGAELPAAEEDDD